MINRISDSPISNLGLTLMNISSIYNWKWLEECLRNGLTE